MELRAVKSFLNGEFSEHHRLKFIDDEISFIAIVGYTSDLDLSSSKGLLGFTNSTDWGENESYPDGNFFLYRYDRNHLNLLSDKGGTRSIWYLQMDNALLFSSMQAPLVMFKGGFKFNKAVLPWLISAGNLGPCNSWDRDIHILPKSTRLKYDFTRKELKLIPIKYKLEDEEFSAFSIKKFSQAIEKSLSSLSIDSANTVHLLSGGIESRLLLIFLALPRKLSCLTWGTLEGIVKKSSDVNIAKKLAKRFDLKHSVFTLDEKVVDVDVLFQEFLKYGEGRVDHISGYVDGFSVWKSFSKSGVSSVIRGDHNFGRYVSRRAIEVRKSIGCEFLSDFDNKESLCLKVKQEVPEWLERNDSESLSDYAIRLGLEYRHPFVNSALNDLKLCFVEVNNPLMNNNLVILSRWIPAYISSDKKLTKAINNKFIRNIDYAKPLPSENLNHILERDFRPFLVSKLSAVSGGEFMKMGLDEVQISELIGRLLTNENTNSGKLMVIQKLLSRLKSAIPKKIKKHFLSMTSNRLKDIRLGFRILIAVEMYRKLNSLSR